MRLGSLLFVGPGGQLWHEEVKMRLTPLNPIHFKPTSLINSAVCTDWLWSFEVSFASLNNSVNDSGEFIVIVAAV